MPQAPSECVLLAATGLVGEDFSLPGLGVDGSTTLLLVTASEDD